MDSFEEEKRILKADIARHNEYLRNLGSRIENANESLKLNGTVAQWREEYVKIARLIDEYERKLTQLE